jgi:hypothetical protein
MKSVLVAIPVSSEPNFLVEWAVKFWRRSGIPHFFSLDSKYLDEKAPLFDALSVRNFSSFSNPGLTIEAGYQNFCSSIPSNLILRVDVDEVLLDKRYVLKCERILRKKPGAIIGLPRLQIVPSPSGLRRCVDDEFSPVKQIQWRGFDKTQVEWDTRVHTAGFEVSEDRKVSLRNSDSFVHLNWVFLNQQQLWEKSKRYDLAGQGAENRAQHDFQVHSAKSKRFSKMLIRRDIREQMAVLERIGSEALN